MQEKKFHRHSVDGVEAVFERMWEAVGRPYTGYALAFDVSENDIKNWRRRGRVSRQYLEGFALEHGVSLDWLLHGEQPEAAQAEAHQVNQDVRPYGLSKDENELLENYRRASPKSQAALLATSAELASVEKPRRTLQPNFGVGAQPGKVLFQAGQKKQPLTTGKAAPFSKKTKKENE